MEKRSTKEAPIPTKELGVSTLLTSKRSMRTTSASENPIGDEKWSKAGHNRQRFLEGIYKESVSDTFEAMSAFF